MPSILVADDNTNIQKMVSLAFEDRGITVVAVGNGEAAVRRIPDVNPDLVLADIFMPVRNGYEVCEFVKKDQRFSHVPVILLVGAFDPLDEKEARRVGADGVLKKPFVPPDPLIAMVISALEKNPRVVAELAKAKASLEEQAAADAAASFEVQTLPKPEPKPLPEFPEPSPEEAAIVYGFGKGIRALDDDEQTDSAKEPPAPVAKRDQEEDEDFEGAATTIDWRRNAMDFEIPDSHANRPAYSVMDELESADFFPSEGTEPKAERSAEAPMAQAEQPAPDVTPSASQEVDLRALEPSAPVPVEYTPVGVSKELSANEPEFSPPVAVESEAKAPIPEPEPPSRHEHEAKPSLVSRVRHWMDALVPSHAPEETADEARDGGDWMAALSAAAKAEAPRSEPAPQLVEPSETPTPAVPEPAAQTFLGEESVAPPESPAHESVHFEAVPVDVAPPERQVLPVEEARFESASTERHDETQTEATAALFAEHASEPSRAVVPEPTPEIWERQEESIPSLRDPDLVVPDAVHVTPEPLLINEEPETASHYLVGPEELPLSDTFDVPILSEPVLEGGEASFEESSPEPPFEFSAEEPEQRLPTGPPPNREALAEIPFLNPPREFEANAHAAPASAAVDSSTVDAVVQKVLEKLQPQLQDLLSQGVLKPLVENLLQQEATKKEK